MRFIFFSDFLSGREVGTFFFRFATVDSVEPLLSTERAATSSCFVSPVSHPNADFAVPRGLEYGLRTATIPPDAAI